MGICQNEHQVDGPPAPVDKMNEVLLNWALTAKIVCGWCKGGRNAIS